MLDAVKLGAGADAGLRASRSLNAPQALLEKLIEAATAASDGNAEKAVSTLENALALLTAGRDSADALRRCPPRGGLAPWQARRVAAYVRDNIGATLRASELATLVRLSYSHFNRAFKVSFHETPTSYIMRQRIGVAQEKMLATDHALSRVALECGLCDQAHFSRMFRRIVGLSPWQWRRQYSSESPEKPATGASH
jgi:transcriptional regulator GlxA family with amidase domain